MTWKIGWLVTFGLLTTTSPAYASALLSISDKGIVSAVVPGDFVRWEDLGSYSLSHAYIPYGISTLAPLEGPGSPVDASPSWTTFNIGFSLFPEDAGDAPEPPYANPDFTVKLQDPAEIFVALLKDSIFDGHYVHLDRNRTYSAGDIFGDSPYGLAVWRRGNTIHTITRRKHSLAVTAAEPVIHLYLFLDSEHCVIPQQIDLDDSFLCIPESIIASNLQHDDCAVMARQGRTGGLQVSFSIDPSLKRFLPKTQFQIPSFQVTSLSSFRIWPLRI